ncbi:unnamed protein product, partial [Mesorhabditis belari]|uniref:VWFA domain-containing protein n=1 Tax=Mesorhabditis belari TaxID=2138241 RepID=A0AAF3FBX1_9BILA
MLWRVVLFLLLISTVNAALCGALQGGIPECSKHTIVIVDASSYLQNEDLAAKLIDFTNKTLLPKWRGDQRTQFSFAIYGLVDRTGLTCKGYSTQGQSDPEIVCNALSNWKANLGRGVLGTISLLDIANDIHECTIKEENQYYDLAILFTANNNLPDIQTSSWFPNDHPVIVVNLGNGDFSSWVATKPKATAILCNANSFDDSLAFRIIGASCGNITGFDECSGPMTTTTPTIQPPVDGNLCDCDIAHSWNDVMILADSSSVMGVDRYHELEAFIQSAFTKATIGSEKTKTRVGVITYSENATLVAPLDAFNTTLDFVYKQWPYLGGSGTNVLGALDMALDEFQNKGRSTSRKVIILGASAYREGDYDSPLTQAQTFQRNFGVIIVIADGDIHGQGIAVLSQLATPGLLINATTGLFPDFHDLTQMLCNANCFCPGQLQNQKSAYFQVTRDGESWPSRGCYWDSSLTSIQALVSNTCSKLSAGAGVPAMPDTIGKQRGLLAGAPVNLTKPSFYLGLTKNTNGEWVWDDQKSYNGGDILGSGDCAVLQQGTGFNSVIKAADCRDGNFYACQTQPCSTTNFCG